MVLRHAWRATAVAVAVTGITGCGGGASGDGKATATPSSPGISVIAESPYSSPSPTEQTPEQKINALAAKNLWFTYDHEYPDAASLVQDVCDTLDEDSTNPDVSFSLPEWLGTYGYTTPQKKDIAAGVPLLCPEWAKVAKQAFSGNYPVWIGTGTFKVTSRRADDTVPPGTYRTTGDLSGCYWERTKADGTIIDNNFATAATRITVTIRASDDLFTSTDCGTWKPVG